MQQAMYFNERVRRHTGLIRLSLVLVLFAGIAQFASFGLIQAHVVSFYGAQPEDIAFAFQITYAGIIGTLPLHFRMIRFFNTRRYLLTALLAGILLNIGCLLTHDLVLFSVLRFLIGVVTCMVAGSMLIVIFSTLPEQKRMLVGISVFFTLVLSCGMLVGIGASWVVLRMDWTAVYYGLIGLQVMAALLCIVLFKSTPAHKPYPLYQVDWAGCILFMSGAAAAAFVMIYGPKRYWMADPAIRNAAVCCAVMIALFLLRQATVKRPLIDLRVFKYSKFIFAISLMILFFGIKDSINLIYGYSVSVLGWSAADVVRSGMYNIAGVVAATLIAVKVILAKKENLPKLLIAGFSVLFFYHMWVYLHLTADLSLADLSIPIFFQGFACGLLFVPITLFCMAAVPQSTGMTGIIVCTYARFITGLNSIAGFYTLQLSFSQEFKHGFLGKLIPGSHLLLQRQALYKHMLLSKGYTAGEAAGISNMLLARSSGIQSQLLTIRAIFLTAAIIVAVVIVFLVLFALINKIKVSRRRVSPPLPALPGTPRHAR